MGQEADRHGRGVARREQGPGAKGAHRGASVGIEGHAGDEGSLDSRGEGSLDLSLGGMRIVEGTAGHERIEMSDVDHAGLGVDLDFGEDDGI
jgi:hypothetical protein